MDRLIRLTLASFLLAGWVWAGPQAPPKKDALLCTLTNQKIEKCCCQPLPKENPKKPQ